jgi:hypothetical protein
MSERKNKEMVCGCAPGDKLRWQKIIKDNLDLCVEVTGSIGLEPHAEACLPVLLKQTLASLSSNIHN